MAKNRKESQPALDPETRIRAVHLTVSELERSLGFYGNLLGMRLGAGREDLVALSEQSDAVLAQDHAGLYHFALRVPSRQYLAQSLRRLSETRSQIQGFADHWVSEAVYVADPDGNGIELYSDRSRSQWQFSPDGQIQMGTSRLDLDDLMAELDDTSGPWEGMDPATVVGHIHVTVGHLDEAVAFYRDIVGFDLMLTDRKQVAFLSAGGYHHHIGLNTWSGIGVPPAPLGALGLSFYTVQLASVDDREALESRLERAGVEFERRSEGLFVYDASQIGVLFVVTGPQES
jgi:catechol 2,3-dioxygenase